MKYIITENKMNDLIEKVLKKNEPEIIDVEFGNKKIKLASDSETHKMGDILERIIIKVTVDNTDGHLQQGDFISIIKNIKSILNLYMNVDVEKYGSKYGVELYTLEKIKKFG
jgi:hypothetical protein